MSSEARFRSTSIKSKLQKKSQSQGQPTGRKPAEGKVVDKKQRVIPHDKERLELALRNLADSVVDEHIANLGHRVGREVLQSKITRIQPDVLIENRPGWVEFRITNTFGQHFDAGLVRLTIDPKIGRTYQGLFEFPVIDLGVAKSMGGAISFIAPEADLGHKAIIELFRYLPLRPRQEFPDTELVLRVEEEFATGARFSIGMNGIAIYDIASHHDDTVFASIGGRTETHEWARSVNLGDHGTTEPRESINPGMRYVGPFDMLPESGASIGIGYLIANKGHTSQEEDAKEALSITSQIGAAIATAVMTAIFPAGAPLWAALSAGADALHQAIINWALEDCDTVVLIGGFTATADELLLLRPFEGPDPVVQYWTKDVSKKAGTLLKVLEDAPILGGGCEDSHYRATFRLKRHTIPETLHGFQEDGFHLLPDEELSFGVYSSAQQGMTVAYEVEGAGELLDHHGTYKAPTVRSGQKFDVIRWDVYQQTEYALEHLYRDFRIVILD